jgi:hypothetical protein
MLYLLLNAFFGKNAAFFYLFTKNNHAQKTLLR